MAGLSIRPGISAHESIVKSNPRAVSGSKVPELFLALVRSRSRIDDLRTTRATLKFLSLEPLLGPLHGLDLRGIDWVIVGGESGPKARAMDPTWATDLRDQCRRAKVPFFFKQWGGKNKKAAGRVLDGRTWSQMPDEVREPYAARQ